MRCHVFLRGDENNQVIGTKGLICSRFPPACPSRGETGHRVVSSCPWLSGGSGVGQVIHDHCPDTCWQSSVFL